MRQPNPIPTVDIIIELEDGGIVLVERGNLPYGWAIPGGFVDTGETLEECARREALEETGLRVELVCQMHAYSDPQRDPRFHTISVVFVAKAVGRPLAGDDAKNTGVFTKDSLPENMAFDHRKILEDYFNWKERGFEVFRLDR